ncbi:NinB protein [Caballeronia turbans]|nr:NinB protein [Caballeronia turbans]
MSDRQLFKLVHSTARQMAVRAVTLAPEGMVVEIKPKTRSLEQNAKLHALFGDIARQARWHGRLLTAAQWKTLFISAHSTATGEGSDVVAGLEGEFVNIRESSAGMSVRRMNSLLEYVTAWCAENEIATMGEECAQ